jgi:hypothetical protein
VLLLLLVPVAVAVTGADEETGVVAVDEGVVAVDDGVIVVVAAVAGVVVADAVEDTEDVLGEDEVGGDGGVGVCVISPLEVSSVEKAAASGGLMFATALDRLVF